MICNNFVLEYFAYRTVFTVISYPFKIEGYHVTFLTEIYNTVFKTKVY